MKKYFKLTLEGRDWSKPFIVFWILFLIFDIPITSSQRWLPGSGMGSGGFGFLSFAFAIIILIITAAYTIKLARIAAP